LADVERELKRRDQSTKAWSFGYHGALYAAVVLSSAAALVLKIGFLGWEDPLRQDWAAILAGLSALIGLISAKGGFETKWRINRRSRGKLKRLQAELKANSADVPSIRKRFVDAVGQHEDDIAGSGDPGGDDEK
jgi:hypothetical protein